MEVGNHPPPPLDPFEPGHGIGRVDGADHGRTVGRPIRVFKVPVRLGVSPGKGYSDFTEGDVIGPAIELQLILVAHDPERSALHAELAQIVALAEGHTLVAQDVICGRGVEMQVGDGEAHEEALRRERHLHFTQLEDDVLALKAIDLVRGKGCKARAGVGDQLLQTGKAGLGGRARGVKTPAFTPSMAPRE